MKPTVPRIGAQDPVKDSRTVQLATGSKAFSAAISSAPSSPRGNRWRYRPIVMAIEALAHALLHHLRGQFEPAMLQESPQLPPPTGGRDRA
jgi:hypothetical protein